MMISHPVSGEATGVGRNVAESEAGLAGADRGITRVPSTGFDAHGHAK